MKTLLTFIVLSYALVGCGVEVGNPGNKGGTTSTTGLVNISFAKESMAAAESLSLNISGLDLLENNDDSVVASLQAAVNQVDLLGLTDTSSEETVVANASQVPVGVYDRIVIRLAPEKPVRYRGRDGAERNVKLDSSLDNSFYVEQSFEVQEGQTTSVVVSLDPYSSLQDGADGGSFVFKPRGGARLKDRGVRYQGETVIADAEWVCAYAYGVTQPPAGPGPDRRQGFASKGGKVKPGPQLEGRTTFNAKGDVVKDATSRCDKAFAKVPVVSGKYQLRHLMPASYSLRFFKTDGSYQDAAEDITLGLNLQGE